MTISHDDKDPAVTPDPGDTIFFRDKDATIINATDGIKVTDSSGIVSAGLPSNGSGVEAALISRGYVTQNLVKTNRSPNVNDDGAGNGLSGILFGVNDLWTNDFIQESFILTNNTATSAVWSSITGSGTGGPGGIDPTDSFLTVDGSNSMTGDLDFGGQVAINYGSTSSTLSAVSTAEIAAGTETAYRVWSPADVSSAALQHGPAAGVTDHGALSGLADDDHSQYLLTDGTRALTGNQDFGGLVADNYGPLSSTLSAVSTAEIAAGTETAYRVWSPADVSSAALQHGPAAGVTDHGALSGLGDDDHAQYLLTDGTRTLTGNQDFGGLVADNYGALSSTLSAVSTAEIAAGTETAYRVWSPADVSSAALQHGPAAGSITEQALHDVVSALDASSIATNDEFLFRVASGTGELAVTTASGIVFKGNEDLGIDPVTRVTSTNAPTVTDDVSAGYDFHDKWIRTISGSPNRAFQNMDPSAAAADWREYAPPQITAQEITDGSSTSLVAVSPSDLSAIAFLHASGGGGGGVTDHGALSGLGDDDHTQYLLTTGTRTLTGNQDFGGNIAGGYGPGSDSLSGVSTAEITAGTSTAYRVWSPADVSSAAFQHGGGGGSGISNIVEDATPQLAADLDAQGFVLDNYGSLSSTLSAVSTAEIAAGTSTAYRVWSPADVSSAALQHGPAAGSITEQALHDVMSALDSSSIATNDEFLFRVASGTGELAVTTASGIVFKGNEDLGIDPVTRVTSTNAPTVTDDVSAGYDFHDKWIRTISGSPNRAFQNMDPSAATADWREYAPPQITAQEIIDGSSTSLVAVSPSDLSAIAFLHASGGGGGGGVTDHGALTGLGDDDHAQYLLTDGTRTLTGNQDFGGNIAGGYGPGSDSLSGVSTAEIAAGTSTAYRVWSPADVSSAAFQHGGGGGGISNIVEDATPQLAADLDAQGFVLDNYGALSSTLSAVSTAEIAAGTETNMRVYSPADVSSMIAQHAYVPELYIEALGNKEVAYLNPGLAFPQRFGTNSEWCGQKVNLTEYDEFQLRAVYEAGDNSGIVLGIGCTSSTSPYNRTDNPLTNSTIGDGQGLDYEYIHSGQLGADAVVSGGISFDGAAARDYVESAWTPLDPSVKRECGLAFMYLEGSGVTAANRTWSRVTVAFRRNR
jgi:NADPH-dependent curcumin reductase CurA